ncbi:MAG: helix-hairpin-helix domain-containing protein, partial [Rikenellaceae bacterium]
MGEKHKEEELKPWITVEGVRNIVTIILVAVIVMLILYIERQHTSIDETKQINSELSTYRESAVLSPFDPNIATLEELRRLGLTRIEALSIIRYREFIKPFRIKEELTSCYNISDSLYYALEPYIVIGEEFKHKSPEPSTNWDSLRNTHNTYTGHRVKTPPLAPSKFLVDTVGVNYLRAIGALSLRQAEVFVKWRDLSGIHCEEELRECYVVSDSIATLLMRYAIFSPRVSRWREDPTAPSPKSTTELVDLNRADSATLRSVRGIGEKSVTEIIKY